jgi:hypothetical protein
VRNSYINIVVALLLFSGVAAAQQMQPFTSSEGRFSILLPGTPETYSSQIDLGNGGHANLIQYLVRVDDSNLIYRVEYCDYPSSVIAGTPEAVLKAARDGNADGFTITADAAIDLNGVPGRAFNLVDSQGNTFSIRQFLKGNRLYELEVEIQKGHDASLLDQFMKSFQIL